MNNQKLWTKDFIIVLTTNMLIFLTFYLLVVTISLYTVERFGATQSQAGFVSGIFVLGAVLARPFAGKWIELIGRKKLLFAGLILSLLSAIAYFFIDSLSVLLVNRLIHGIAFGVVSNAAGTIVADIIPNERRGEGTGYFSMSMNLAMAFGPFLGLIISQNLGYDMIFVASLIITVFGLIVSFFLKVPNAVLTEEQKSAMKGFKLKDFFESSAVPISIVVALAGFSYSSILNFLTPYAKEIDLLDEASFFFVVFAVFLIASRPFTGRLFDLKGANVVIYPCLVMYGIGQLLLSHAGSGWILLVAGAIIGVSFGTFQSSSQAIAVMNAQRHRMGLATSTYFIFYDLGIGIGPFIMGFIIPITGFSGLFTAMAALVACIIVFYYFLHGKKAKEVNQLAKAS